MTENVTPKKRITSSRIRLVLLAWGAIVMLAVLCVFLATNLSSVRQAQSAAAPAPSALSATETEVQPPPTQFEFGYGIQVQAENGSLEAVVYHADQLGLNWVKQQLRWADVQPTPDQIQWTWLDDFIEQANAGGLKVMLSIVTAPEWSRTTDDPARAGPPDDPLDYTNFVIAVLQRYPGKVHAIEVWNEQNLQREWYTEEGLDAQRYLEMLRLTHDAVKAISPETMIVSGALAPTGVNDGVTAIDDFEYLSQMIDAGLLNVADCIGAHHTGINLPPDITASVYH